MDHGIGPGERAAYGVRVAHVAAHEVDLRREVRGSIEVAVHLRGHGIEHSYAVAVGQQLVSEMRSDETRATRNQDAQSHVKGDLRIEPQS
jgi:hypothetical protein